MNKDIEFSHRHDAGLSIGVAVEDNTVFFATSCVNFDAGDHYDRRVAVRVIRAKVREAIRQHYAGGKSSVAYTTPALGQDARAIMKKLRPQFQDMKLTIQHNAIIDDRYLLADRLEAAIDFIKEHHGDNHDILNMISPETSEITADIFRNDAITNILTMADSVITGDVETCES